jgi:TP901 family phage tail tape measure protein
MGLSAGTAFVDVQPKIGAGFQGAIASKLGPLGVAGGAALAGGIALGVGGAVALKNIGDTFDTAFDTIRVGTGATGEDLAALQEDFKAVFADVPADAQVVASALADISTRTGLVGQPLQDLTGQLVELGRITGEDVGKLVETSTRQFGDWGVAMEDAPAAMDALFRASQATGPPVSRLQELLVKYGAPLRQFGFGMEESAALLGKFEREGVNTELVMGSLRVALGKVAREGGDPAVALQETIDAIQNAGSAGEANALALELFGARAGPDMAAAIREGRFELGDLFDQVTTGGETIRGAADETSDYRESWEKLKNRVFVALEPIATRFLELLGNLFDFIADTAGPALTVIGDVLGAVGGLFSGLGDGASDAEGTIGGAFSGIGGLVESLKGVFAGFSDFVTTTFGILQAFWDQWGGAIMAIFGGAFSNIVTILTGAFDVIRGLFDFVLGILSGDWERAWNGIKAIFSGVIDTVVGIVRNFFDTITGIWHSLFGNSIIVDGVRDALARVVRFFVELPGRIFSGIGDLIGRFARFGADLVAGLIRGLGDIAGAVFDKVKGGIGKAIDKVKGFFGIGSPSRVMADVLGLPLAQGIALGTEATGALAGSAMVAGLERAVAVAERVALPDVSVGNFAATVDPRGAQAIAAGDSAEGGTTIQLAEGAVQVFNPEPEPASLTVPRELRRLAVSLARA